MNLQELRYVVAVAETMHFGRAAEACYVSQPTLSTQIKKFEDELGVRLFERTNKRVLPTPAGQELIAQARVILEETDKLREMAQHTKDPMAGPLRLGLIPTLAPYLLPYIVPPLRATYPQLRVYLREEFTDRLVKDLHVGTFDAVLVALPIPDDRLEVIELFREPFIFALPVGHSLCCKAQVCEADLHGTNLLLLEEGHCLRDQALAVCGLPKLPGAEEFKASSLETLRQMVAAGVACTLLPALAATPESPSASLITLRPFADPVPYRTIGLVYRRGFPRLHTILALAELIRQYVPDLVTVLPE